MAIMRLEGVTDSGMAKRILAEWSAMALHGFTSDDSAAALIWACRNSLRATKLGDDNLPDWSK